MALILTLHILALGILLARFQLTARLMGLVFCYCVVLYLGLAQALHLWPSLYRVPIPAEDDFFPGPEAALPLPENQNQPVDDDDVQDEMDRRLESLRNETP